MGYQEIEEFLPYNWHFKFWGKPVVLEIKLVSPYLDEAIEIRNISSFAFYSSILTTYEFMSLWFMSSVLARLGRVYSV